MNIQELVKILSEWTDQNSGAQWTLTNARRSLVLSLSIRGSSRRMQFVTCSDWPDGILLRAAMRFVDGY